MQAMILAAGFGTRLLPHTLLKPKPLFPILNQPLLLLTIAHLQNAGCDHILVNCHHLLEQVVSLLDGIAGVTILEEDVILGTGGGLRGAVPYLRDEPLLVTNGDIYHCFDFTSLYIRHAAGGRRVSLAMHNCRRFNNVRVDDDRVVEFAAAGQDGLRAFTGLHVIDPEVLESIARGRYSCILERYRNMLATGKEIGAIPVEGYWTDMGTVEDYLALHKGLLLGDIPRWPELGDIAGAPFFINPRGRMAGEPLCEDWCCLGEVEIGEDVRLARLVAWDGVRIKSGSRLADMLISS